MEPRTLPRRSPACHHQPLVIFGMTLSRGPIGAVRLPRRPKLISPPHLEARSRRPDMTSTRYAFDHYDQGQAVLTPLSSLTWAQKPVLRLCLVRMRATKEACVSKES